MTTIVALPTVPSGRSWNCWSCTGFYNTRKRRERVVYAPLRPTEAFMHACMRPMEAACFHIRKCANNHQLIVVGIQRFLRCTYTARFCVIPACKTLCALRVYKQTLIGVFFVHKNGNTHTCLTQ